MDDTPCCEVKTSRVGGRGTFATRDLKKNTILFRELAFLSARQQRPQQDHDTPRLSSITVEHKHCPPCVRLDPADTGGTMSGSQDTFRFVRAYAAAPPEARKRVLQLAAAPFGRDDTHAIVNLVQAEVGVLRDFDDELGAISASELARAVHRYWANCIGREGSLYERGSLFNHSCAANCTHVTRNGGGSERAFVTLRPIAAGEELTLSYLPSGMEVMGTVVRRRHLWLSRGFLCGCDRCSLPRDEVRQVECPECCANIRRQRRRREERVSRSGLSPKALCTRDGHSGENETRRPTSKDPAVFADWWNQSRTWVCRSCGWCSDAGADCTVATPPLCLHRKEGILSAEVFALVMANTAAGSAASGSKGRPIPGSEERQQARRDAVQGLLENSVALLGRRHWATFSCVLLRLEQEVSALSQKGSGRWSASDSSRPKARTQFLDWAMQELNALWQWLSVALETSTSHPPAYYLLDVVCGLLGLSAESGTTNESMQELADRVEPWVSAFADEEQRRRFAMVVAAARGAGSDRTL